MPVENGQQRAVLGQRRMEACLAQWFPMSSISPYLLPDQFQRYEAGWFLLTKVNEDWQRPFAEPGKCSC